MAEIAVDNANQIEERWHPSLYFADGDIVVSAVSKDKSYIEFYRVDRVFLARHSTIFKDMFVVGEGNLGMEQYDGVPKVHLPDDAEDVAGLLSAVYDIRTLPLSREPCSDTPLKVQGIMRLAVKYEVETIRGTILKHVESEWPQTLEEWERRCNEREGERTIVSDPAFEKEEENYPDPALAVRFGLEFNCPKILPAAFYDLATARGPIPQLGTWGPPISWECLRAADLLGLIAGQKALAIMSMEITTIKWGCPCEQCSQIVQACLSRVLDQGNILNPLVVLRSFSDQLSSRRRTDFCDPAIPCLVIPDETKSMAEVLWRELPLIFNLSNMNDGFE